MMECKQNNHQKLSQRTKRQAQVLEDQFWDCSVCTYRNTAEAYKCLMCDVRKGTSTRKPRINHQLVAQTQQFSLTPTKMNKKDSSGKESGPKDFSMKEKAEKKGLPSEAKVKKSLYPPRLKNVDRSTAQTREVTVNNVTVLITEYKPKQKKTASEHSGHSSSASSENGSQSESSTDTRGGDIGADSRSS